MFNPDLMSKEDRYLLAVEAHNASVQGVRRKLFGQPIGPAPKRLRELGILMTEERKAAVVAERKRQFSHLSDGSGEASMDVVRSQLENLRV